MNRPEFTREQEDWLCYVLDEWYLYWKNKICEGEHRLGFAKEILKAVFCNYHVENKKE